MEENVSVWLLGMALAISGVVHIVEWIWFMDVRQERDDAREAEAHWRAMNAEARSSRNKGRQRGASK